MSDTEFTHRDVMRVAASLEPFDYIHRDNGPGQFPSRQPIYTQSILTRRTIWFAAMEGNGAAAVDAACAEFGEEQRGLWEYVAAVAEWFKAEQAAKWQIPDDVLDATAWLPSAAVEAGEQ